MSQERMSSGSLFHSSGAETDVLGLECRQETAGEELYGWAELFWI